jgi:hypothetical protein
MPEARASQNVSTPVQIAKSHYDALYATGGYMISASTRFCVRIAQSAQLLGVPVW